MKKALLITLGVIVGVAILIGLFFMSGYNKLISLNESVKSNWAQIDNQLKRRNDLIPNLVSTVKGYAGHEKGIFENVANARSKLAGATTVSDKIAASGEVSSALSRLLMIAENYPQLKANENFNNLSYELAGTENRISVERMRYNDSVRTYNVYTTAFPGRFFAAFFGYEKATYFQVEEKVKEAPVVDFGK